MAVAAGTAGLFMTYKAVTGQQSAARGQDQAAGIVEASAGEARELASLNVSNIFEESGESIRRTKAEQEKVLQNVKATQAASGITTGGSTGVYLEEMSKEFAKEIEWMQKSAESQAAIAIQEGESAATQAYAQAAQTRAGAQATRAGAWGTAASGLLGVAGLWS